MLYIEYEPSMGFALRDGDIEAEIILIKTRIQSLPVGEDYTRMFATDNIFRAIRLEVARDNIKHNTIMFKCQGREFGIDQDGDYIDNPRGFLSTAYNISKAIVEQQHANFEKRKEERNNV